MASRRVLTPDAEETGSRDGIRDSLALGAPQLKEADKWCSFREEIVAVGSKLWQRGYVDGNAGNISVRVSRDQVLCTPTMMSKGDLRPDDLCLSDLQGNILDSSRQCTSELRMHIGMYAANPRIGAIVHCHPPYGTAFAVTGSAPPFGFQSEYEFLIGPAAVARYETPGTDAFAASVLPFILQHNTIVLQNHGVVCWADTVTHAEWLVEVFEAYCKTILVAQQIGKPLIPIPEEKIEEILSLKRRMGLPDARLNGSNCTHSSQPEGPAKSQFCDHPPKPFEKCS